MTQEAEQFFATQKAGVNEYTCVEIRNDEANILYRLVRGNFGTKSFIVDGVLQEFLGAGFEVPEQEILADDDTEKGDLSFSYVGYETVNEIRKLDSIIGFSSLKIRILQYFGESGHPQTDYTVYSGDISFDSRNGKIKLTSENFEKQTRADKIVTTDKYPGVGL